ncbi:band 4.1-like protein 3a isoform X5 [Scleropages formosus]|uniref:band 4.1-like protein 3a isoform X5 n=1 Tax=Scleropages formosus TaxID=113540 RepID=UPI0010FA6FB7|nr:band 4.1-like protein 3 isoform X5 [Scleropages formosus]
MFCRCAALARAPAGVCCRKRHWHLLLDQGLVHTKFVAPLLFFFRPEGRGFNLANCSDSEPKQEQRDQAPPTQPAPPLQGSQPFDGEQFPAAAGHSTPAKKDQSEQREAEGTPASKLDYQIDDDKTSQRSSSSKLSKSPLKTPKKSKNMQCKVTLLDGSDYTCVVEKRAKGQLLFDKVCDHLNLLEKDYFGITFRDMENQKNWLDPAKELKKQIRSGAWNFAFNVKFYPPDPAQLSEDITRYYLCLQLRDDVVSGRLPCSFATHTVLGSYTVQSELGDYDPEELGTDYVSEFRFAPNQTKELEEKIMDLHKNYKGMTPAEAEMHFLENAKKLSMYGVDLHHAKDSEGVEIMLGVCASGLLIYRDRLRINRFAWPKVLKISYKRNNFYIKIRPGEFEQFESTIGFKLPNHRAAKRLWKVCVEHHTFFRLVSPEAPPKKFLTLGSKFRYSGRTQAQTRRASSQIVRPAPYFERSSSKRYTMSRSLDGAPMTENQEILMKDSVSASEVGTAQYGTAKAIATGDLITTVTPEKKAEEEKAEEEEEKTQVTEPSEPPVATPIRPDTKTDSEQTDFACDGETTATESDQEDEISEIKTQYSFVRRVKGENVFVKHSNLMLEETATPDELLKRQTNISELKRSFLETGSDTATLTEWEKRLSTSPVRSPRLDDAPMIEPLVPEDTKEDTVAVVFDATELKPIVSESKPLKFTSQDVRRMADRSSTIKIIPVTDEYESPGPTAEARKSTLIAIKEAETPSPSEAPLGGFRNVVIVRSTEEMGEVRRLEARLLQKDEAQREGPGELQPSITTAHYVAKKSPTFRPVPKPTFDEMSPQLTALLASARGQTSSVGWTTTTSHSQTIFKSTEEAEGKASETLEAQQQAGMTSVSQSPVLKTEPVSFSSTTQEDKEEFTTKEVPVVHTETKTITYESSVGDGSGDSDPGILMSAQTITSETTSTTTTTHITKTVKGGISETRIEKRIVITGDADIDHDQALAQAIKEAKEQHPDMSVTKVVVHKETEITPEEGDE